MARVFLNVSNNVSRIYRETLFATTAIVLTGIAASPASAQSANTGDTATTLEPIVIQGAASDSKTDRTSVAAKNSAGATKLGGAGLTCALTETSAAGKSWRRTGSRSCTTPCTPRDFSLR